MAHPMLNRRFDRRTLAAAGTTAALLAAPGFAATAEGATVLETGVPVVDTDTGVADPEAGSLSQVDELLPQAVQSAVDPIEKVVDDVLRGAPAPVPDVLGQVPAVEGVVEQLPPVPATPLDEVTEALPVPADPAPEVGTAGTPAPARATAGPPQGPGTPRPPFTGRNLPAPSSTTFTRPFVAPAVSGPFLGNLPRIAEDFLSRAPAATSDALSTLRGPQTTTAPGPDAPSWLLATAAGMLLLLGASHVVHARHRFGASVAR